MKEILMLDEPIIDVYGTFGERIIKWFLLLFFIYLILSIFLPTIKGLLNLVIIYFEDIPFRRNKRIKTIMNIYIDWKFGSDTERIIKINKYKKAYFVEVLSTVYEGKEKFYDYRRFFPFEEPNPYFDTDLSRKVCDGKRLVKLTYFSQFIRGESLFSEFREFREFCAQKILDN